MASVSSNWAAKLAQYNAHGSGAGLTTISTAATTFVTAVAANLPGNNSDDATQRIAEERMLQIVAMIASEFN